MSQQQHTQGPAAWRITFKSGNEPDGFLTVHYHGTNAIADYREIDPDAKSYPLYVFPPDASACIAELEKQRDTLLAALEEARKNFAYSVLWMTLERRPTAKECDRLIQKSSSDSDIGKISTAIASVKEQA